jgi:choline-sulfatase
MSAPAPNVLLLMADQLAASWLPAYGHGVVQAPILTALARDGATFEAAYCAAPLCAPSRAALLTGLRPSRTEVFDNAAEMRASLPTIAHHLRAAGYATSLAGKMHFVGPDQLHGFEERLTPDVYPAGLDWTPDWSARPDARLSWYHTMESVLRPGVVAAAMQVDYDDEVAFHGARALLDHARRRPGEPFFHVVSFANPHDPWELPRRYWDSYDPGEIEPPAVPPIPLEEADPHSRRLRAMCGIDEAGVTEAQVRRARHAYYAAISYLDERIGHVLDALDATGLADDTIVVFTADHGEMLGERGLWFKMSFFEQAARVPLIVRAPGRVAAGVRIAAPVSQVDLAPTLLDLCGHPDAAGIADGLDGTSLGPLLGGADAGAAAAATRGAVIAEYLAEGVTGPALMIRRDRFKYVVYGNDPERLYDLAADPHELRDLAGTADGRERCAELRRQAAPGWDPIELAGRVLASQRERRLVVAALGRGRAAAWDYVPPPEAGRYVGSRADLYELQRRARLDAPQPRGEGSAIDDR